MLSSGRASFRHCWLLGGLLAFLCQRSVPLSPAIAPTPWRHQAVVRTARTPASPRQGPQRVSSSLVVAGATSHRIVPDDRFAQAVEVEVRIAPGVTIRLLEASVDWQEQLIQRALDALDVPEDSIEVDPYGAAMWPAAQVLAQGAVAYADVLAAQPGRRVLELGAGCGLASLAVATCGVHVLATDLRALPLELLTESARRQGVSEWLETSTFDVRDASVPLPEADLVMASDVLYEKGTAEAMARRVMEARERGSAVLISDIGRPNKAAFLAELSRLRSQEPAEFSCHGAAVVQGTGSVPNKTVAVRVLELPRGPASDAIQADKPCVVLRPDGHAHVL